MKTHEFEFIITVEGQQIAPAARELSKQLTQQAETLQAANIYNAAFTSKTSGKLLQCRTVDAPGTYDNLRALQAIADDVTAKYPGAVIAIDSEEPLPVFNWMPHLGKEFYNYA